MKFIIIIVCFLLAAACAEQAPQTANNQESRQNKPIDTQLNGDWQSLCVQGTVEFVQEHIHFNNGTYHQRTQFHPDVNCSVINKSAGITEGSYAIGNEVMTTDGLFARELDFNINENGQSLKPLDIFYLNTNSGELFFAPKPSSVRPMTLDLYYPYKRSN